MNLYEHTIIARQDTSPSEIKQLTEKYSKIVEKNEGEIVKTENWGLLNLSYLIKNIAGWVLTVKSSSSLGPSIIILDNEIPKASSASKNNSFTILYFSKNSFPMPTTWDPCPGKITENILKKPVLLLFLLL